LAGKEARPVVVGIRRGEADLVSVVRVGPETDPSPVPRVPKAWAGVSTQVLLPELAKALGVDARSGLRVTQLVPGGSAEKAGLRVGDILLRLDGKVIPTRRPEDADWFGSTLREHDPAATVSLDILRDGQPLKLDLALAERPAPASELPTVRDLRLGFSARALGFDDRQERRLAEGDAGVVVTRVERSGWADLAGLRAGDILTELNGRALASNDDLRALLDEVAAARPRHVVFRVRRGVTGSILECEPDWAALAAAEAR
jgi:serine protease Do